jgi:hypothetical protein
MLGVVMLNVAMQDVVAPSRDLNFCAKMNLFNKKVFVLFLFSQ